MKNIFQEKHLTPFIIFFISCLFYNLFMHRNYLFVFIIASILIVCVYHGPKRLNKQRNRKKEIKQIIESFDLKEFGTNMYDIYKVPKAFKYIFIKQDILDNLINLKFTKQFDNELYTKTFVVLENFLKLYYKSITNMIDDDKEMVLNTLTQLHEDFKHYKEQMKLNIPIMSRHINRFKNRTLHKVIDDNYLGIDNFMKRKIQILKSVDRG